MYYAFHVETLELFNGCPHHKIVKEAKNRAEQFVGKLRNEYNTDNVRIIEFPENGENGVYVFAVKVK